MARGIYKNIIKSKKEALNKLRAIGAENIKGVSGEREAWNPTTGEATKYHTIYYNVRAEIEISVPVMEWFVSKGIFVLDD